MLRVGVNGFGTIGKRVADAVGRQPDMRVVGVAKTNPNYEAEVAAGRGYAMYVAGDGTAAEFGRAGIETAGSIADLVERSDVIVDATPSGVGETNKSLYEYHDTPALFQGGESADVAETSFNARANFEDATDASYVRVVSCNTTGLARLLSPLRREWGIDSVHATLVRRGGDPGQTCRGPINDTLPDPVEIPSHHAPDLKTVFPDLDVTTMGMKVPATLMHTHGVTIRLEREAEAEEVRDALEREPRLFVLPDRLDIDGAGKLKAFANDAGRPRGDIWENCIWGESISVDGHEVSLFQAIHQEADVVPENVDALRAIAGLADREESMQLTDETLGMDRGFGSTTGKTDPARTVEGGRADD